ncbi:DinB family protein [Rhodonellum sp.]|uniref:DinB family protein n=1 Tax=Rhodonellum sp. TaxID=2231180 RepID=UPI0027167AFD|nr:DinB family protein [Rhodonellum sp.]MDO9553040.1 DinB family protein [Rhodonellum sp.]
MNDLMRPKEGEYAPFYAGYISLVIGQDLPKILLGQINAIKEHFEKVGEENSKLAYASGKWSQKEVLGHVTDTDRIMTFRALCFARGEKALMPGFDQDEYVVRAKFNAVPLVELLDDFEKSRHALVALMKTIPNDAMLNIGNANGFGVSVRALFNIIPGHAEHHLHILKTLYARG